MKITLSWAAANALAATNEFNTLTKSLPRNEGYIRAIKTREALLDCEVLLGYGGAELAKDLAKCTVMTVYDAAKLLRVKAEAGVPVDEIRGYVAHRKAPKEDPVFNDAEVLRLGKIYTDSGIHKDYGVSFASYIHAVGLAIMHLRKPTA